MDLPPHVRVVLQESAPVDFGQSVSDVSRGYLLFAVVGIELRRSKILYHKKGTLQLLRIKSARRV